LPGFINLAIDVDMQEIDYKVIKMWANLHLTAYDLVLPPLTGATAAVRDVLSNPERRIHLSSDFDLKFVPSGIRRVLPAGGKRGYHDRY
jgi:hypothetical protein